VADRLDEERLEILRTWGAGLSASGRDELRAAGKAIVMLIEEIDRLQADVWMAREVASTRKAVGESEPRWGAMLESEPATETSPEPIPMDATDALTVSISERIARGRTQSDRTS
jgi:hypothetical protein